MAAVIDKALDFIGGMDTSAPEPHSMDESTIKGMLKYLKELGVSTNASEITARGNRDGWNTGFINKIIDWANRIDSGEHIVIKNPEYFSSYMREQLRALV
ncbi:DUF1889 family protein [uncultured Cedecea sp.]|uniref:DUF1889 family protein n=1 Tax=uncultured Cedecea sp. TaxID=988762 RepID=UPI0026141C4D|nr:DUF1889 family protein [uncultured Cedecea sp.]